jgi:hypothetical protein
MSKERKWLNRKKMEEKKKTENEQRSKGYRIE